MEIPSSKRIVLSTLTICSLWISDPLAAHELPTPEAQAQTAKASSYTIQQEDSLWGLAEKNQVDIDEIVSMNPYLKEKPLPVGRTIRIPSPVTRTGIVQPVWADENKKLAFTKEGQPVHYQKKLACTLTAYTAGPESTGKSPGDPAFGITASGAKAKEGTTIAVDPRLIPIGSRVYIEGLGFRKAQDTGGLIKGQRIDVFFENKDTAITFGVKRNINVYIEDGQAVLSNN